MCDEKVTSSERLARFICPEGERLLAVGGVVDDGRSHAIFAEPFLWRRKKPAADMAGTHERFGGKWFLVSCDEVRNGGRGEVFICWLSADVSVCPLNADGACTHAQFKIRSKAPHMYFKVRSTV